MKLRSLSDRVYNRTNKNDGWFRSKTGYSIRFNWMRSGFEWLMGEYNYNLSDWGAKVVFQRSIWEYVRKYPARVIAKTKGKYGYDLAHDGFERLLDFFIDTGLIQIQGVELWELPTYQVNNVVMFVELVKDYFFVNQDLG